MGAQSQVVSPKHRVGWSGVHALAHTGEPRRGDGTAGPKGSLDMHPWRQVGERGCRGQRYRLCPGPVALPQR